MVVTDLRRNLVKVAPSDVNATGNPNEKEIRRIIAEDSKWCLSTVPLLKELALAAIVKNFEKVPILEGLPPKDKAVILEKINVSLPLKITAHTIEEESYWKRTCKAKYNACDVTMHGGNWKRMYFEKYLQMVIENFVPEKTDPDVITEALNMSAKYVKKLEIKQLLPPTTEPKKIEENYSESAMSLSSNSPSTDHFNFEFFLENLPHLEELRIKYGVRGCGMNFEWSLFEFTIRDCNQLANSVSRCQNLRILSLHQSKVDDEKVRILIRRLLDHPALVELDLSHNCISDRGSKAIGKLINNRCPNLKKVCVRNNIIRVEGAKALAYALVRTTTLAELDLRLNRVEDEGGQAIMRSLIKNTSLQVLRLSSNDLSERTAAIFAQVLQENKTLTTVDLSGNRLGPDGGKTIQEGIAANDTIVHLDLRLTEAGQENEYCIHQRIKENTNKRSKAKSVAYHVPL